MEYSFWLSIAAGYFIGVTWGYITGSYLAFKDMKRIWIKSLNKIKESKK